MKILLIADGRSPITLRWIESMREDNIDVYLASSYPCARPENISGFYLMPVAFANFSHKNSGLFPYFSIIKLVILFDWGQT